ncbi:MAG: hypothetical protein KAS32_06660 [Candidatus Peribacteraceae bacterium]|nr:hypothetical protein [Candidatus Peribacteraceae bacterium]
MKKPFFAAMMLLAITTTVLFTSCNKNKQVDHPEMIEQSFTLEGVGIPSAKKAFNINTWLFQFNDNPYTFTMTGIGDRSGEIFTQDVTIQDMQNGSFNSKPSAKYILQ